MARLANVLLRHDGLPDTTKRLVEMMTSDAFDPRIAIILVCVYPLFSIKRIIKREASPIDDIPDELCDSFDQFKRLQMLSLAAANPVFSVVLLLEAMILAALLTPFQIFSNNSKDLDQAKIQNFAVVKSELALRQARIFVPV